MGWCRGERNIMKTLLKLLCMTWGLNLVAHAEAPCEPGVYGDREKTIVAMTPKSWLEPPALGYLFLGTSVHLDKLGITSTKTQFEAAGVVLAGELLEPDRKFDTRIPLVVMVQGSERTAAIGSTRAYLLAAQGISVFTYDKRGTGQSEGLYTQNFELLADDAVKAMGEAQRLAEGRFDRVGFFGGSQGGWVAPLAATRTDTDFVAVGYGLVASPIEEDRDQMLLEAQALEYDEAKIAEILRLSEVTSKVVVSGFTEGLEELQDLRDAVSRYDWPAQINGEYSGDMLRMNDIDLRRIGRAVFDNVELIWDYDSVSVLEELNIPLLWVIAEQDREAPIGVTLSALKSLKDDGRLVDIYVFPNTDHGVYEFTEADDGTRTMNRVSDGYIKLIGDWIREETSGNYGRSKMVESGE